MAGPQSPTGLADGLEVGVPLEAEAPFAPWRVNRALGSPVTPIRRLRRTIECRTGGHGRQMSPQLLFSQIVPLAFAAGLNVYATIAVIGLSGRFDLVSLPESLRVFENPWVIGVAVTMFAIEFIADKIPWFDSVWDAVHTVIRPIGGAFIGVTALGAHASPAATTIAA